MQQDDAEPRPAQTLEEEPYPSPVYAWYVVGVLMIVYAVLYLIGTLILAIRVFQKRDL